MEPHIKRAAPVVFKECVTSTNTIVKALAASGLPDGFVLAAGKQTSGRGRLGRSFESPDGGLYLSALFYPKCSPERFSTLTPCAAVAVSRAIERVCTITPEIKWPNDLQLGGKKLCGILTESSSFAGRRFVVIGIGLNVNTDTDKLPEEVKGIAVSLSDKLGKPVDIRELTEAVVAELDRMYAQWSADGRSFLDEYRRRCSSLNRDVILIRGDERREAHSLDVDESYALVVEAGGRIEHISFGEISVKTV